MPRVGQFVGSMPSSMSTCARRHRGRSVQATVRAVSRTVPSPGRAPRVRRTPRPGLLESSQLSLPARPFRCPAGCSPRRTRPVPSTARRRASQNTPAAKMGPRSVVAAATPMTMPATETMPSLAPRTPARSQFSLVLMAPTCGFGGMGLWRSHRTSLRPTASLDLSNMRSIKCANGMERRAADLDRDGAGAQQQTPLHSAPGPAWSRKRDGYRAPEIDRLRRPGVPYAELHAHSAFSFLDGAATPEELVEEAARLDLRAIALTDHDGLYGVVRFAEAAKDLGIETVFGAELSPTPTPRTEDPDPPGPHLLVLARGPEGYRRLSRQLAAAHLAGGEGAGCAMTTTLWSRPPVGTGTFSQGCRKGHVRRALSSGGPEAAAAALAGLGTSSAASGSASS